MKRVLLTAAPTLYNASIEAMIELDRIGDPSDPRTAEVLGIIAEMVAWIHSDPDRGHGLCTALGVEHRNHARYGDE